MAQYDYNSCPEIIKSQIDLLISFAVKLLGSNLLGAYLHGSLAMGCFNPKISDIDILMVIRNNLTKENRILLTQELLRLSGNSVPIEISIVVKRDIDTYSYPMKYNYHYSEAWRESYVNILNSNSKVELENLKGIDPDLTAHIRIIISRGICLYGDEIREIFSSIPEEDYFSAIISDIQYIEEMLEDKPVYCILNLCRIYWFVVKGVISSKDEAGQWAIDALPQKYRQLLCDSLEIYRGRLDDQIFDMELLRDFFEHVTSKIANIN